MSIHPDASVHPTAVVDPSAEIAAGVVLGPHAVIGAEVALGEGTTVGASACVEGPTTIGRDNRIFAHACIGFDPQDLKFHGERTALEVGDRNHFREFTTVHRGTAADAALTRIGSDNLFMAYKHIAHDCVVGDHTIFANAATLAGHVRVDDHAVIGAHASVHQHCRVGVYAYTGGYTVLTRDALPYVKTVGAKPAVYGINRIGLARKGFTDDELEALARAYRILVRSRLNTGNALATLRDELGDHPRVKPLIDFVESSTRGVVREQPRGGARGG
ncbi:MAG: acyl-ACP--UDP-N-acetylglucosamine O-acyltransferase [Acidobacteriota bacterium]